MSENSIICVACPVGCRIKIKSAEGNIEEITGYQCEQGRKYAVEEFKNPTRILPTTVRVKNGILPLVSVKTAEPIPKSELLAAMEELARVEMEAPVECGQVVLENVVDSGVTVVATNNVETK